MLMNAQVFSALVGLQMIDIYQTVDVGIVLVGPAYPAGYGNSDLGYTSNSHAGPYRAQQVCAPSLQHNIAMSTDIPLAKAMR